MVVVVCNVMWLILCGFVVLFGDVAVKSGVRWCLVVGVRWCCLVVGVRWWCVAVGVRWWCVVVGVWWLACVALCRVDVTDGVMFRKNDRDTYRIVVETLYIVVQC